MRMIRVGTRLRDERIKKELTIEEVARATKIRPQFISAIEKGEYSRLPSSAYALGFVKNYINFLGLPSRELLAKFHREFDEREYRMVLPQSFTQEKKLSRRSFRIQRLVLVIVLGLILVIGYLFFQYRFAFINPALSLDVPRENTQISANIIMVQGTTDPNITITINGVPALVDNNGHFKKEISVFAGKETIIIKAINSFGKTSVIERHVVVREE